MKNIGTALILLTALAFLPGCAIRAFRQGIAMRTFVLERAWEADAPVEIGPVLVLNSEGLLSVNLLTGNDSLARLRTDRGAQVSGPQETHSFPLGREATGSYLIDIDTESPNGDTKTVGPFPIPSIPTSAPFDFVVYGDPHADREVWPECSRHMMRARPAFALALGDMVQNGPNKTEWEHGLFKPARAFFATVPHLAIAGNHDVDGDAWLDLLMAPRMTNNWTTVIGPVRIVGVDAMANWDSDERLFWWLESVLTRAREPFLFLAVHVPPFSSSRIAGTPYGNSTHNPFTPIRRIFVPLMERAHGTAILSGHTHAYERSELPSGLSCIVSSGAGNKLYPREEQAHKLNPYSKVFAKAHHFLVISVANTHCSARAVSLDGSLLDQRTWEARRF